MWRGQHRQVIWGVAAHAEAVVGVQMWPTRRGLRQGVRARWPMVGAPVGLEQSDLPTSPQTVAAVLAAQQPLRRAGLALALDESCFRYQSISLPAWLAGDDWYAAIVQAWSSVTGLADWALDACALSPPHPQDTPEAERIYEVVGMPRELVLEWEARLSAIGVSVLRIQPYSWALFRGWSLHLSESQAPLWLWGCDAEGLWCVGRTAAQGWCRARWPWPKTLRVPTPADKATGIGAAQSLGAGAGALSLDQQVVLTQALAFWDQQTQGGHSTPWRWAFCAAPGWEAVEAELARAMAALPQWAFASALGAVSQPHALAALGVACGARRLLT